MQLVQSVGSLPNVTVPPSGSAQPAAPQPQMLYAAQLQPAVPEANTAALTRTQQLALADAAIADVHAIAAHGERLIEALADAAHSTPQQLQQQVTHSDMRCDRFPLARGGSNYTLPCSHGFGADAV
jgi:hypothetical protein